MNYTAQEIVIEGYRRAGRCINEKELARAAQSVLGEIKHDIWNRTTFSGTTQLRALACDAVMVTKAGKSRYLLPTDFNEMESMHVMSWSRSIPIISASFPSTVVCAGAANLSTNDVGRRIIWRTGVAEAFVQEISALALATNWALDVEANFEEGEVPAAGTEFSIVDQIDEMNEVWNDEIEGYAAVNSPGRPTEFFTHSERLQLDRPCDREYALRLRYYVDITRVQVGSKIDQQINRRWYSVLVKGVYWVAAQEIGDTVAREAYAQYLDAVEHLKWRESDRGADETRMVMGEWH